MANEVVLKIASPDDALGQLFDANSKLIEAVRVLDEAKAEKKRAEDYRDGLLVTIDRYTSYRKEKRAQRMALGKMFDEEPLPPWMSHGPNDDTAPPQNGEPPPSPGDAPST